jgi:hypothetical protein
MTDTRAERGGRNTQPRNARDCGVRALAIAADIPYQQAFDMLAERGRKQGSRQGVTNWSDIEECLYKLGHRVDTQRGTGTLKTAGRNYPGGVWIFWTRDHFAACVDGTVHDLFASEARRIKKAHRII